MQDAAKRLRLALDMYEVGEGMQRQRLRRTHPDDGEQAIAARLRSWRHDRPGAEHGDCPGRQSHRLG